MPRCRMKYQVDLEAEVLPTPRPSSILGNACGSIPYLRGASRAFLKGGSSAAPSEAPCLRRGSFSELSLFTTVLVRRRDANDLPRQPFLPYLTFSCYHRAGD